MKKKLIFAMSAIVALFATSCQEEDFGVSTSATSTVAFTVSTPEIASRAYSDGTTATKLQYAVYDAEGKKLETLGGTTPINGSTSVKLDLITGDSYSVIFWAAAEDAPYKVDFATKTMTVDYNGAVSNAENRDAFYKYHTFTVTGAQTETVELKRPFAQLNIGTNDYATAKELGYEPKQSTVTVKKIYSTLNLATGDVDGETAVTFGLADIKKDETFPVADHEYIAMNYLLVGADKELVDVEFACTDGSNAKTRTVGSVPVQRNYRTNIYGKILTSEVDVNIDIEPDYDDNHSIYNVTIDGVSYDDFATAVAKAMELNKSVELIQNVSIDADNTIAVPAGKTLTLNLNGYTLSGVSNEKGSNRNMFDVQGTMNVNGANTMTRAAAAGNGIISIRHDGENMGWGSSTNVFNVTAGGVLNIKNVHAINFGGSDMGFVAHLNNWGEVTLNVENSTLESNYVAVRVFNSGYDKNNVTINNSTLKGGSYAFWVHNYTVADFGTEDKAEAQKELLNFDIFDGTNKFNGKNETPIRYGFTDAVYANEDGVVSIIVNDVVVEGIGIDPIDGSYAVTAAAGLDWIAANVAENNGFEGKTIKLMADVDLKDKSFAPIGYNPSTGTAVEFKGIFDGNNKTIKNISQSDLNGGYTQSVGLFAKINDATIKNIVVENIVAAKYGAEAGAIASVATGDCTFENIVVKSGSIVAYNNDASAILGWGNVGNFTFKDITIGSEVTVYSLWDSYDTSVGGIIGTLKSGSTATFEDINVACKLDAYNDVCANYQWGAYRRTGMLIGNMSETQDIDGTTYPNPEAAGVTCNNVTVTYGDWMNYHYCEFKSNGHGSYDDEYTWKHSRVERSDWGSDGIDITKCNHESFESHNICMPVNQLFGGGQGVYGLATYDGITVNYPESFYREQGYKAEGDTYTIYSGNGFKTIATTVLNDGTKNVTIELANDIDLAGIEWPAVKTAAAFVLDGKGYAIKNLTTSAVEDHGFYSTAMFTSTRKATTIKNVVVENATVTGKGGDNSHGAVLVACNYAALNIEGVTVKNSTVSNCDRSSVITTYLYFTTATVKDCVVEGCIVNSIGTAGALLGMNNGHDFEATGNTVKKTTISSSEGSNKAGILIGTWQDAGTLTESNNVVENSKAINAGTETNNNIGRHA